MSSTTASATVAKAKAKAIKTFECSICCADYPTKKAMTCLACHQAVCVDCQRRVQHANCIHCRCRFTKQQIVDGLGTTFIRNVIVPQEMRVLIDQEKLAIPNSNHLLEHFRAVEYNATHKRFGMHQLVPEFVYGQANYSTANTKIPCSDSKCRGYCDRHKDNKSDNKDNKSNTDDPTTANTIVTCNLCKLDHCVMCRSAISMGQATAKEATSEKGEQTAVPSKHVCDPDVIKNLELLKQSSRPCPKCASPISRTEGCDHMHCINCNTHFNWNTGVILKSSSNHHYRALAERLSVRHSVEGLNLDNRSCVGQIDIEPEPRIPNDVLTQLLPTTDPATVLLGHLYVQRAEIVRFIQLHHNLAKLTKDHEYSVAELRVKYMTNRLTEDEWGKELHRITQNLNVAIATRDVLSLYIDTVDTIQSSLHQQLRQCATTSNATSNNAHSSTKDDEEDEEEPVSADQLVTTALATLAEAIVQCNRCLDQMNNEFILNKTTPLRIRAVGMSPADVPAVYNSKYAHQYEITVTDDTVTKDTVTDHTITKDGHSSNDSHSNTSMTTVPVKEVSLRSYQVTHYARLVGILGYSGYALDLSPMGTGKTYIGTKLMQGRQSEHNLVVCPASLVPKWRSVTKEHGLTNVTVLSYSELASTWMQQPKHGFLFRDDSTEYDRYNNPSRITRYRVTPRLMAHIRADQGLSMFIDEFQHIKNYDSCATKACSAIIKAILQHAEQPNDKVTQLGQSVTHYRNRVILFSGTPMDQAEQCTSFYRTIGVNSCDQLIQFNPGTGQSVATGIAQIYDYVRKCYRRLIRMGRFTDTDESDVKDALHAAVRHTLDAVRHCEVAKSAAKVCANAFIDIVLPTISSQMFIRPDEAAKIIATNTFYTLGPEEQDLCNLAMQQITMVVQDRDAGATNDTQQTTLFTALHMLEESKLTVLLKHVHLLLQQSTSNDNGHGSSSSSCSSSSSDTSGNGTSVLDTETNTTDKHNKVVIVCNSLGGVHRIQQELEASGYSIRVLTGNVSATERDRHIQDFQQHNNKVRVLVGTLPVICSGIDLDDKHGSYPREVFIMPCYSAINMLQMMNRFVRSTDTKSNARVRFVYSTEKATVNGKASTEDRLIRSVMAKNTLIQRVAKQQVDTDYPREDINWL
jgi:hypothetical protein